MTDWAAYGDCDRCGSPTGKPCVTTWFGLGFGPWKDCGMPHVGRGMADTRKLYVAHIPATGHITLRVRANSVEEAIELGRVKAEDVELGEPLIDGSFFPENIQSEEIGADRTLI